MHVPVSLWIGFNVGVALLLTIDLGVFNQNERKVTLKEAALWSGFCIGLALLFNGFLFYAYGKQAGIQFLTGYLVELSLSVDNLFVFAILFSYFHVPARYQHRVLFWGIFGAIVMRAFMIFAGVALLNSFHWLLGVFGAFLVLTGIRMMRERPEEQQELEGLKLLKFLKRFLRVTPVYHGERFLIRDAGRLFVTPLMLVLIMIELTDVIFALDSIPAILGISRVPFIVYSSNILAIIGLRAMYFVLAHVIERFSYLHVGISVVLIFIGVKMILELFAVDIPIVTSLLVIAGILLLSILPSLIWTDAEESSPEAVQEPEPEPIKGSGDGRTYEAGQAVD